MTTWPSVGSTSAGSHFIVTHTGTTGSGTIYSRAGDYDTQISFLQDRVSLLESRLNEMMNRLDEKDKEIQELKQKEIDDDLLEIRKRVSKFKLLG